MKFINEKGNLKIIIAVIVFIILLIIGIIAVMNLNRNKTVETIQEEPYEYFTISTLDGKVGVIDKKGNEIIKPEYMHIYIPNQSKDVFVCFKDENSYSIFDKNGKDIFTQYNSVYPIVISSDSLEMEKKVLSYEKYMTMEFPVNLNSLEGKSGYLEFKSDVELKLEDLMFSIYTNRGTIENLKINIDKVKEETNYSPFD